MRRPHTRLDERFRLEATRLHYDDQPVPARFFCVSVSSDFVLPMQTWGEFTVCVVYAIFGCEIRI